MGLNNYLLVSSNWFQLQVPVVFVFLHKSSPWTCSDYFHLQPPASSPAIPWNLYFTFLEDNLDELPDVGPGEDDGEGNQEVVGSAEDIFDHDEGECVAVDWGVELCSNHADTEQQCDNLIF